MAMGALNKFHIKTKYDLITSHHTVQTVENPYHASLAFLVSGQAQQGFNFFSGSLETVTFVAEDIFV